MLQGMSRQRLASAGERRTVSVGKHQPRPGPSIASRFLAPVLFGYALPEHRVPSADEAGLSVPAQADFQTVKFIRQEDDHDTATIRP